MTSDDVIARAIDLLDSGWESDDPNCVGGKWCWRCAVGHAKTLLDNEEPLPTDLQGSLVFMRDCFAIMKDAISGDPEIRPFDEPLMSAIKRVKASVGADNHPHDRDVALGLLRYALATGILTKKMEEMVTP